MRSSVGFKVLVVVIASGLTACTTTSEPPTSPAVVESSSPEYSVEPTAAVSSQVFEGDCDTAFPPAVIASVWGAGAHLTEGDLLSPRYSAVEQLGGIVCTWAERASGARADLVVLPVSAVSPRELGDPHCYGPCRFGVEASGLWLSGVVSDSAGTETASRAIVDTLSAAFTTAAATSQSAVSLRGRGSWSAATDCADLSESAAVPSVLDVPSLSASPGNGMAEVAEGRSAAITAAAVSDCIWQGDGANGFAMTTLPGGAWIESELRASGTISDSSVTGAQTAFFLTTDGSTSLEVFADGNWMELLASDGDNAETRSVLTRAAGALVAAIPR